MTLAAFMTWVTSNQALLTTLALVISEYLGANPKVRANGILSFILIQVQKYLKERKGTSPR